MLAEIKHKMVRGETIFSIINDIYFAHKNAFKNEVDRILLGMTVLTRYNNKTYRVSEVNFDMKPSNTFEGRNGEQIRYIDYYRTVSVSFICSHFQAPPPTPYGTSATVRDSNSLIA